MKKAKQHAEELIPHVGKDTMKDAIEVLLGNLMGEIAGLMEMRKARKIHAVNACYQEIITKYHSIVNRVHKHYGSDQLLSKDELKCLLRIKGHLNSDYQFDGATQIVK